MHENFFFFFRVSLFAFTPHVAISKILGEANFAVRSFCHQRDAPRSDGRLRRICTYMLFQSFAFDHSQTKQDCILISVASYPSLINISGLAATLYRP